MIFLFILFKSFFYLLLWNYYKKNKNHAKRIQHDTLFFNINIAASSHVPIEWLKISENMIILFKNLKTFSLITAKLL